MESTAEWLEFSIFDKEQMPINLSLVNIYSDLIMHNASLLSRDFSLEQPVTLKFMMYKYNECDKEEKQNDE